MTRISRKDMLMQMAWTVSKRSTCARSHVGVIVATQGRPLVSGYNGAPMGMPHCDHTCNGAGCVTLHGDDKFLRQVHGITCPAGGPDSGGKPCTVAVHGEANAIAFAARHGVRLEGASLFTTLEPCLSCAMLIINAGIVEVVYSTPYRDHAGMSLLRSARINTCMSLVKE
jgi:dCMP deaminase